MMSLALTQDTRYARGIASHVIFVAFYSRSRVTLSWSYQILTKGFAQLKLVVLICWRKSSKISVFLLLNITRMIQMVQLVVPMTYSRDKPIISVSVLFRSTAFRFRCFAVCRRLSVGSRDNRAYLWDGNTSSSCVVHSRWRDLVWLHKCLVKHPFMDFCGHVARMERIATSELKRNGCWNKQTLQRNQIGNVWSPP